MVKPDNRPIGIFDSGVGGLTVLAKIHELLPNESTIYVGDTANAPYGGKTPEALLGHGRDIINFLCSQNVKAVVFACGTTSSTVYEQLVAEFPQLPLVDVIRPAAKACIEMKQSRLGIIATAATIKSGLLAQLIKTKRPSMQIKTQACPLFMPMVEAGITHNHLAKWAAETYVGHWKGEIDALVLGCTHYPLLTDVLTGLLGKNIQYINLATYTAQALSQGLAAANGLSIDKTQAVHKYYVSGEPDTFNKTAHFILGSNPYAEKIHY
ncbi:MAG: glutamate racemase [Defluviitaleaceae bacterium]|nr:glutamate racemase [Defluviitaleaceae bacterium]